MRTTRIHMQQPALPGPAMCCSCSLPLLLVPREVLRALTCFLRLQLMAPFLSFLCSFPARNPAPVTVPWLRVQGLLASRVALSWLLQRCLPQLPSALQLHWSPHRQHCWDLHNANTSISLLRCQGVHRCIDLETTTPSSALHIMCHT